MLKPLMPKLRPDLSARLKGVAENRVTAKLKPIVGVLQKLRVGYSSTCALGCFIFHRATFSGLPSYSCAIGCENYVIFFSCKNYFFG